MSKILVLAEKPSVGRDIAKVLNCKKGGNGYLEGERYVVTWALGHLVTLADPEVYDHKYKSWNIEDLPMIPKHLKLVVIKKSGKQFNVVKSQMNRQDVNEIVIATDAGREGELVARWIIEKSHIKKPIKRLWISSVTDKAIKDGFKNLKDGREYNNLYKSAIARAEADWLVGINATRALTCKYNAQLSCGRVQTPTIAMIAEREEEIKNFKPKTYYGIEAKADKLKLVWQDGKSKDIKTFNKDKCENIFIKLKNKDAKVIEVNKVKKKKFSPQLYDLTELQRDANKIFNFSAKETLSIMQRLYENHKVLTYPRTDSRYITVDVVETLKDRLKACGVGEYSKFTNRLLKTNIKGNKGFVDNSKVSDHHAIIPTEQKFMLSSLSDSERKIYDLVVKRFLAILYPPFEYEQTTIKAKIGEEYFIAKGKIVLSDGWKEIYSNVFEDDDLEGELKEQILPSINKGDTLKINSISKTKGETKPPKPFNEGTLLSAMENPVKYMREESKELKKTIGETGGIGTVATRADIIEKLFNTFLIEKRGKDIFITSKGKQLLELVPEELKSPALTAEWEQKLIAISKGKLNKDKFLSEIKDYSKDTVDEIKNSKEKFKHDNITRIKCPECGKYMLEVNGKKGKMLVCQDRECGYRKGISRISNARCPECHKKLELRGEGEGQIFVCKCGYREKLSSFKERKKKGNNKLSKKEVNKYLKQQQKQQNEEPFNNAFAEAFAKLGLK
ncbi:DNA topoisomerase III [Clostridium botulinum]|uniref:DNA topoisomerase 3 n=1 Tax=Clostridium botulinum C/D str. DC5 TaxID=1443128 RepID=A0A0A0IHD6_CLOBO|nr:DNA topoisomerase III [Clostridium botulinum]KGM99646.1 DNA topoisomerase III [Clostridium botulinum C/D str. DC5]KOC51614.1 DNA topoisomerase III [Clostridium botulinum]KOC53497.1 DNA topoisomerase III [Clostridium botulinum]MCD3234653.1 DNA topoisomerase III [Clostridium botulinum D/C]MCD3240490.1 DNA topoisomerase III [Clostridium botulinum D/C]